MNPHPRGWPGLGASLLILVGALAAQVGAALGWKALWGAPDLSLLAGVANLVALTGVAALGYGWSGEGPAWGRTVRPRGWFWAGVGLSATGATVVLGELANLTTWLWPLPPGLAQIFDALTRGSPLVALFTLSIVAPFTEELLFRGLLLRGLARRYGVLPGVLVSSALFALFHLNVWQAGAAFVAGLYLGWLYLRTGSLWPSMVAHGWFNGLPVALASLGFTVSGYNTPWDAHHEVFQPWPWVATGAAVLAGGLWLSFRWAPLPPPTVSDRLDP